MLEDSLVMTSFPISILRSVACESIVVCVSVAWVSGGCCESITCAFTPESTSNELSITSSMDSLVACCVTSFSSILPCASSIISPAFFCGFSPGTDFPSIFLPSLLACGDLLLAFPFFPPSFCVVSSSSASLFSCSSSHSA